MRRDAVTGESADDDEVVLRVKAPGRPLAHTVVLYPKDGEWDCDCPSKELTCSHVAAAAISLTRAREQGQKLPISQRMGGSLSYRFERASGGLVLRRHVVQPDGSEQPLDVTLASVVAGRVAGPAVSPTETDLDVDRILGLRARGTLPPEKLGPLLAALAERDDVRLDGRPVRTSGEAVVPRAIADEHGDGFRLTILRDPAVTEVVANGVALCGKTLRPLGHTYLTGPTLDKLPMVRDFSSEQVAELVTDILPALAERVPLEVRTERLPQTVAGTPPRLLMQVEQEGHVLSVMPLLVYGPASRAPYARIDGGRLVHLRGPVPLRDEAAEHRLVHRLRDELNLVPGRKVQFSGPDAMAFATRLQQWNGELGGEARRDFFADEPLDAEISIDGDTFDVSFSSGSPGRPARHADPATVLRAWRQGEQLVPLLEGGWAPLPAAWLARHGDRVADLLGARDERKKVSTASLPVLAELCDELGEPRPPGLDRLAPLIEGFETLPSTTLPADLTATLRHYQRTGVDWLVFLREARLGGVLADDMGLGKTVQALCALRGRSLVVCPTSVLHNWAAETARFRPALRACIYHGPRRELDESADLILTSYTILRIDAELLTGREWDTVVLDEAQAIKNPDSQVARVAYELRADFRLTMSGTPVENRLDELWSQMHFVNRGLLGGRRDFQDRYARPVANGEPGAAERLRRRIRPFVLRRLKREVAPELPPRTDMVLRCELHESERVVYDAVRAATQTEVVARLREGGNVLLALEALLRLRQASCHPSLIPGQQAPTSSKIEVLLTALDEAVSEQHKALVFSQWTSLLDLIEPHLTAAGIPYVRLDGSTRDRAGVVAAFQADDGPPVMLVSLKAGGVGLNLTAADHVFLMDPWWNPAVEDQAADRTHRIGQDKPVMVYRLVAANTVEERILALQERKRGLADAALGGADRAASLTRDDLLALLE